MDKEKKNFLYTFLYLLALYLGVKMVPFEKWIKISWIVELLKTVSYLLLLLLALWECKKENMKPNRKEPHLNYLFLIPLFLGPCSNLLYGLMFQSETGQGFDAYFAFTAIETLECVILEEILFRLILFTFLQKVVENEKRTDVIVILLDSLFFSLMHAVNFFGNNPLNVFLQMGYTFILGVVLSNLAINFETPFVPVFGHFLFNFLNTDLAVRIYSFDMSKVNYLLFSVAIALFVVLYTVGLYLISKNKQRRYEHANQTNI